MVGRNRKQEPISTGTSWWCLEKALATMTLTSLANKPGRSDALHPPALQFYLVPLLANIKKEPVYRKKIYSLQNLSLSTSELIIEGRVCSCETTA